MGTSITFLFIFTAINFILVIYLLIRFVNYISNNKINEQIRKEQDSVILEFNKTADRNISLLEDRIGKLDSLFNKSDKKETQVKRLISEAEDALMRIKHNLNDFKIPRNISESKEAEPKKNDYIKPRSKFAHSVYSEMNKKPATKETKSTKNPAKDREKLIQEIKVDELKEEGLISPETVLEKEQVDRNISKWTDFLKNSIKKQEEDETKEVASPIHDEDELLRRKLQKYSDEQEESVNEEKEVFEERTEQREEPVVKQVKTEPKLTKAEIINLLSNGKNMDDIVNQLDISHGELQLLLSLDKKRK